MKGFLLLLSFMTRIPMPNLNFEDDKLGKSMKFFPLVGAIIGLITVIIATGFDLVLRSSAVALPIIALVIILVDLILTGALHLDGLADTFDGIFSYRSKQKMLEIMKDSRLGSNGALALILYFLIKFILLLGIALDYGYDSLILIAFTAPIVARFCSVVSCASAPYASPTGMGKTFVENTNFLGVIISFILTVVLFWLPLARTTNYIFIIIYGILFIILGLISFGFSKLIQRKIGGITGDTLGAILEISTLLYLFLMLIIPNLITTIFLRLVF